MPDPVFATFLSRFFPLGEAALRTLEAAFKKGTVDKRGYVLNEGDSTQDLFFLKSGVYRGYNLKGYSEHTFNFFFGPTFYADIVAVQSGTPTLSNIQALEGGEVWTADIRAIEALGDAHPDILKLFIRFYEVIHSFGLQRQLSFIYDTAEVRYMKLLEGRPRVAQEIPLAYIASYLGIKPESLSRIRGRMAGR